MLLKIPNIFTQMWYENFMCYVTMTKLRINFDTNIASDCMTKWHDMRFITWASVNSYLVILMGGTGQWFNYPISRYFETLSAKGCLFVLHLQGLDRLVIRVIWSGIIVVYTEPIDMIVISMVRLAWVLGGIIGLLFNERKHANVGTI